MEKFWLCFVPLFMAVNAVSLLPMFIGFTEGLTRPKVQAVIIQSVLTAAATAMIFLAVGRFILDVIGITVSDFMIAGGALLFVIALNDLLSVEKKHLIDPDSLGAVPLGVPLIVGPAVLTTIFLLVGQYGLLATVTAAISNILIAGVMFWFSEPIIGFLGKSGAKTVSKLGDLILAAFAVMLIRRGILLILANLPAAQ